MSQDLQLTPNFFNSGGSILCIELRQIIKDFVQIVVRVANQDTRGMTNP